MKNYSISLDLYLRRDHSFSTSKQYLYHINRFLKNNPNASEMEYVDIVNDIIEDRHKRGGVVNIETKLAALKRYYDYLIETGVRNDHPCKTLKLKFKKAEIQIQDLFSNEELSLLLTSTTKNWSNAIRHKLIISFLIYQGITSHEVTKIKIKDIDLEEGKILIKPNRKTNGRVLNLKPNQIGWIHSYLEKVRNNFTKAEDGLLLLNTKGMFYTPSAIFDIIENLKPLFPDRILNPTTIRQSFIANLLNQDKIAVEHVQLIVGHQWPMTTTRYQSIDLDEKIKQVQSWHPLG